MGLEISASALRAVNARQAVTANNVANLDPPAFQAQRAELVEQPGGGVRVGQVSRDETPGAPDLDGTPRSNVNLAREATNQISDTNLLRANANALRAQAQLQDELLRLTGD